MEKSLLQTEKACYVTGQTGRLHRHHIFGGGRRDLSERYGLWVWLAPEWHNMSRRGVHFNRELDLQLKQAAQREFEARYGHEKWMELMGKNYLEG